MISPAAWLHPAFTLIDPAGTITAGDLVTEAKNLAATLTPGCRVGLTEADARHLLTAMLACEQAGTDLFVIRDATELPDCHFLLSEGGFTEHSTVAPSGEGLVWLQTSGSTGRPKWVPHRLDALIAGVTAGQKPGARWFLSYAPASFAGLQVILSSAVGGHTLIVPPPHATAIEMATFAIMHQATHLSGTPTFWRSFLLALGGQTLPLKVVTLGGEAADQPLLDALQAKFPATTLRHLYATTEAGIVFSVADGLAGFPRQWLDTGIGQTRLAVTERGTLAISSPRVSRQAPDGFYDTGDCVALTDDRVLFRGRIDSMVNIGGVKVWPEEVEAHLLQLPFVQDVLVSARPNPLTGSILVADLVLSNQTTTTVCEPLIKSHLASLPRAARPAALRYRESLASGATGKKSRAMA